MGMILGNKVIQTLNCLNKNCAPIILNFGTDMDAKSRRTHGKYQIPMWVNTSHSAYDAMLTESNGVKIDGFLYPNFM